MQFGLHNVFTHETDRRETTHAFKDYTDRESEITAASTERDHKVYRRLGPTLLQLITKMQKLHKQCSYHALINYYCSAVEEQPDGHVDLSLGSTEESMELTQKEISTISTEISEVVPHVSKEQDIIRHHTPQYKVFSMTFSSSQVIAFVRAVIKDIIPHDFFGSEHNMSVVLDGAEKMVNMRRFENISLHAVMNGIKVHFHISD